jgi:hypothetical protein
LANAADIAIYEERSCGPPTCRNACCRTAARRDEQRQAAYSDQQQASRGVVALAKGSLKEIFMIIYGNDRLIDLVRYYFRNDRELLDTEIAIVHLRKLNQEGRYDHNADLQFALEQLKVGRPVILLGRLPIHDYQEFVNWKLLEVDSRTDIRFLQLNADTPQKIVPLVHQLIT